jgi:hypothetical protein
MLPRFMVHVYLPDRENRLLESFSSGANRWFPYYIQQCVQIYLGIIPARAICTVALHYGTLQNGTLQKGTLQNSTLQNGTLQNGTLQIECRYKTVHVTKQYVTKRYGYKTVTVTKQYTLQNGTCCKNGTCSLSLWRVVRGSKLMHLDLIHGLFIT